MNHWMFRCQDVSQKVSQSMDTPLPFHHRMAIRMHLWMCRYCALVHRQLMMLRKIGRQVDEAPRADDTVEHLSEEAKARIKKSLQKYTTTS